MNIVIPAVCEIGANKVRIRSSEKALQVADCRGQMSMPDCIIRLSLRFEGSDRVSTLVFDSLLHEIIHWIDHLYIRGLEEQQVAALASGLAQALISLGFEPDFSQIPEE